MPITVAQAMEALNGTNGPEARLLVASKPHGHNILAQGLVGYS